VRSGLSWVPRTAHRYSSSFPRRRESILILPLPLWTCRCPHGRWKTASIGASFLGTENRENAMRPVANVALSIVSLCLFAGTPAMAGEGKHAHWEYAGAAGPEHWGELEAGFASCSIGRNQSPINVTHAIEADLPPIAFDYQPGGYRVVNNGHAIQVDFKPGSHISIDGTDFELKQLHFHAPSENTIEGKSFPLEAHLVHADAQGNLAVVAVLFEDGGDNAWLGKVWPSVPGKANSEASLAASVAASDLLPANRDYFRYSGSLTTPPCSEDVRWLVLKQPVSASAKQIEVVHAAIGHDNNRPIQPVGARIVAQ